MALFLGFFLRGRGKATRRFNGAKSSLSTEIKKRKKSDGFIEPGRKYCRFMSVWRFLPRLYQNGSINCRLFEGERVCLYDIHKRFLSALSWFINRSSLLQIQKWKLLSLLLPLLLWSNSLTTLFFMIQKTIKLSRCCKPLRQQQHYKICALPTKSRNDDEPFWYH